MKKSKWILLSLTILGYMVVYLPLIMIAYFSFNKSERIHYNLGFSFTWYTEIFNQSNGLLEAILNTLEVAILSTIFATIIGTITAIGIHALSKSNRIKIMILNNVPVINPDIVTGVSLWLVFSLLPISFGMPTMLLAHIFFSTPFVVLNVLPKLKKLDKNLFDAALDLGCNRFQGIYKVILPSITSGIIAGALIAFTMSIDDFVISYFTSGAEFQNVSLWIYSKIGRRTFSPAVYAYNTIIVFVTVVGLFIYNLKLIKKRRKVNEKNFIIS
jgi:spermidine/putrescine transport system permease protein